MVVPIQTKRMAVIHQFHLVMLELLFWQKAEQGLLITALMVQQVVRQVTVKEILKILVEREEMEAVVEVVMQLAAAVVVLEVQV